MTTEMMNLQSLLVRARAVVPSTKPTDSVAAIEKALDHVQRIQVFSPNDREIVSLAAHLHRMQFLMRGVDLA